MTTPGPIPTPEQNTACPFCAALPLSADASLPEVIHPANACILSGARFPTADWNRRASRSERAPRVIRVTQRSHDWHVAYVDDLACWESGQSAEEAIGKFLISHRPEAGIALEGGVPARSERAQESTANDSLWAVYRGAWLDGYERGGIQGHKPYEVRSAEAEEAASRFIDHRSELGPSRSPSSPPRDTLRLDAIERGQFRVGPDGMDGWLVRVPGTLGGMRQGFIRHGAHRLREAIDAALGHSLSGDSPSTLSREAVPEADTKTIHGVTWRRQAPGFESWRSAAGGVVVQVAPNNFGERWIAERSNGDVTRHHTMEQACLSADRPSSRESPAYRPEGT